MARKKKSTYNKEYYESRKDIINERRREWNRKNPKKLRQYRERHIQKKAQELLAAQQNLEREAMSSGNDTKNA